MCSATTRPSGPTDPVSSTPTEGVPVTSLTIVMPVFNERETLRTALDRLLDDVPPVISKPFVLLPRAPAFAVGLTGHDLDVDVVIITATSQLEAPLLE